MKIAITSESLSNSIYGQGRVTFNLIKYLSEKKDIELTIIGDIGIENLEVNANKIIYNRKNLITKLSSYVKLIKRLNDERFDILHCPTNYDPPYFYFIKSHKVRTLHDASGVEMFNILHHTRHTRLRVEFKALGRLIDRIATDSYSSKREIIKHYGFEENKVDVIYLGADERFKMMDRNKCKEFISKKYGINKPFIFHVSGCDARKNISGIIKAFIKAKKQYKKDFLLVIAGGTQRIPESYKNLSSNIIFMGYIPDEELPIFYNAAEIFIFPSFHEGFGLPILEAMKCGTPVITSNVYATKEIAGDSAILVNPYNVEEISGGILTLLNDRNIWYEMQKKGLERAKKFTWENFGEGYIKFYRRALNDS